MGDRHAKIRRHVSGVPMTPAQGLSIVEKVLDLVLRLLPSSSAKADLLDKLERKAAAKRRTLRRANERLRR